MAVHEAVSGISIQAGEDLTAGLHKLLFITTTGFAIVQTTAQGMVNGICGMNVASGGMTSLVRPDGSKAVALAGATFAAGDKLACDTTGRLITWVDAAGNNCVGVALEAGVVGQKCSFLFSNADVGGGS